MPSLERDSSRIVIAGASSLLGAELRSLLEESRFAASELRLVDEVTAVGTLTEAGGEPVIIQPVEEGSFERAKFVFFTGSEEFSRVNLTAARATGARVIDLSGTSVSEPGVVAWFPKLDWLLGREFAKDATNFAIPSAAATAAAGLALALGKSGLQKLSVTCFQPVSEAGRAGIEELETQTGQLLSFQGVGQPVFDTQVAFNMLDRFGPASLRKLSAVRERVRVETRVCVDAKTATPAIQVLHAPVFYGTAFSASAELGSGAEAGKILQACRDAGFAITADGEAGPSNVNAAGEKAIQLAVPEPDPGRPDVWWFWGAADNIRLPAANAVKLAEMIS
ncbi:MAG TPA: Asd/ArgC dimerization domain-containing protein [Candidatus Saccharimonadales bacterium]|nr:Asd/ArgC dimerization domain-containing protein [Candidatus Saccharimonadales bacterium]